MKPAPFDYARPSSLRDTLDLLSKYGDEARILAGGQSLGPMLNMRLIKPRLLIDISGLPELHSIDLKDGFITIGASITQNELLCWPDLFCQPLLGKTLPWVGHYQTRQRGTICGSIVHSDPSSELPLALILLDGKVQIQGRRKQREISGSSFHLGVMQTSLAPDEMVTSVSFPSAQPNTACAFKEVGPRLGDFAITAAAAIGDWQEISVGFAGVADVPRIWRLPWLEGKALEKKLNAIAWELGGNDDLHASAKYRRKLVRTLGKSVIEEVQNALSGCE